MTNVFFEDPLVLFQKDKIIKLWPQPGTSQQERVNASARFILFATCGLYMYTRNVRVFALALVATGILYFMYQKKTGASVGKCHPPTPDNPMGNFLQSEFNSNRKEACDYQDVKPLVKEYLADRFLPGNTRSRAAMPSHQKYAAERQWVMNPARDNPNAQMEFAEFCYGKKNQPTCRDNPIMCDPNARGAQLEAFSGLDISGAAR